MKIKFLLLISIVLLSVANVFAANNYRYENVKHIKKNYPCSSSVLVALSNKYGNMSVEQWDRNEVSINIDITVKADSERKMNETMDKISIEFISSSSKVSATTIIQNMMGNSNVTFNIYYHVFVPRKASMNLTNTYGNVDVSRCDMQFSSVIKYGNLRIDMLNSNDATMDSKYGHISINRGDLGYAKINIAYGDVVVDNVATLDITSRYGNFAGNRVDNINISSKYDNYKINESSIVNIKEGGYTNFTINKLRSQFVAVDGAIRYGEIKIGGLTPALQRIKFNGSFSNVKLGFDKTGDYNLDLLTSYGNIKIGSLLNLNVKQVNERSTSIVYSKSNGGSSIEIKNKYADINLDLD